MANISQRSHLQKGHHAIGVGRSGSVCCERRVAHDCGFAKSKECSGMIVARALVRAASSLVSMLVLNRHYANKSRDEYLDRHARASACATHRRSMRYRGSDEK